MRYCLSEFGGFFFKVVRRGLFGFVFVVVDFFGGVKLKCFVCRIWKKNVNYNKFFFVCKIWKCG